jgi:hypothetical protein
MDFSEATFKTFETKPTSDNSAEQAALLDKQANARK